MKESFEEARSFSSQSLAGASANVVRPRIMKTLLLLFTLCHCGLCLAEPHATGIVGQNPMTKGYYLRFTVSKGASPGVGFYPNIRFVLDDLTWIDGHLSCFPSAVAAGKEGSGAIEMWGPKGSIPEGRFLKHVVVMAAVGNLRSPFFWVKPGQVYRRLDEQYLKKLETDGAVVIRFPFIQGERAVNDS